LTLSHPLSPAFLLLPPQPTYSQLRKKKKKKEKKRNENRKYLDYKLDALIQIKYSFGISG
jgi:hypothetical protein